MDRAFANVYRLGRNAFQSERWETNRLWAEIVATCEQQERAGVFASNGYQPVDPKKPWPTLPKNHGPWWFDDQPHEWWRSNISLRRERFVRVRFATKTEDGNEPVPTADEAAVLTDHRSKPIALYLFQRDENGKHNCPERSPAE